MSYLYLAIPQLGNGGLEELIHLIYLVTELTKRMLRV